MSSKISIFIILLFVLSCSKKTDTIDAISIDRNSDNEKNKEDFMKDVLKKEFFVEGSQVSQPELLATIDYEPIWNSNSKTYFLKVKPTLNLKLLKSKLELDSKTFNKDVTKCSAYLSLSNNLTLRIVWIFSYNDLIKNETITVANLNSETYNKFLNTGPLLKGNPSIDFVEKHQFGFLSIGTSAPDYSDMKNHVFLSPFYFGK